MRWLNRFLSLVFVFSISSEDLCLHVKSCHITLIWEKRRGKGLFSGDIICSHFKPQVSFSLVSKILDNLDASFPF